MLKKLRGYENISGEVKTKGGSRLDLLLTKEDGSRCFIEIKNSTLVEDGLALFPDAVTSRGLKHLKELRRLASRGFRCVMFYLVQRMDAKRFSPADRIDPKYGSELRNVVKHGVEILVYDVHINLKTISVNRRLPHVL